MNGIPFRALRLILVLVAFCGIVFAQGKAPPEDSALPSKTQEPPNLPTEAESEQHKWCDEVSRASRELKWKVSPCDKINWRIGGTSVEKRPLVFAEFGKADAVNTTLVFAMVHGDEITPLYLGIQLANWLRDHQDQLKNSRVVIAPLVNPDSFFRKPRIRMNSRGVDVNRNFLTPDWNKQALQAWKRRYRSDPRRFPGNQPRSEPETLFQEDLIKKFQPKKILSIHSPLNHLDYDGPSAVLLAKFSRDYVRQCLKLRSQLKAVSTGFFPGSLGNYAGRGLGIPTLTLELPSADPTKAHQYWVQFSKGIHTMIDFEMPPLSGG